MFKRIDHLVVATGDLAAAAQVWEATLSLKGDAPYQPPADARRGAGLRAQRLPVGDAFVELVEPVGNTGRFAQQFRQRGEGLYSLVIEVDDVAGAIAHLRARGVQVSDPDDGIWPGTRIARVRAASAHGVPIQLIQHSTKGGA